MDVDIARYGAGGGIALGAGIGGTAATFAGLHAEFALLAGFGVSGGLLVGALAGRFANSNLDRENWQYRVVAFTLALSLAVGAVFGALTAWIMSVSLVSGFLGGGATGGVFSLLLAGVLLAAIQQQRPADTSAHLE